jgi:high-affinity K+ transport system ATPase subunit B
VARELTDIAARIGKTGGTPLAVARDGRLLGAVNLKDIVKGGIRERFGELPRMGIRTVIMASGSRGRPPYSAGWAAGSSAWAGAARAGAAAGWRVRARKL